MRWTRYAGWANIVLGVAIAVGFTGIGIGVIGLFTGAALVGSGIFMVWLASGWDKPVEDLNELHKYGRPANARVLEVEPLGDGTVRMKLQVAPVNESDYIVTRTFPRPGRVPAVGETVTVKFDPQSRKNLILLEESYMVEDHLTAARRMFTGGAATALAVLAFAAPAGAAVTQRSSGVPVTQVELAGERVVFGSFGGGKTRVLRADPGGPLATLAEFTGVAGEDDECCETYYSTGFSASATQVAVSDFYEAYAKGFLAQSDYRLRVGPVGDVPPLLFTCQGNHPYDVDGDRIAYLGDDCTERTSGQGARMVVRNLAAAGAPAEASFPMTEQPNTVDLAGNYVALAGFFNKPPELRVYDTATSGVAYSINHGFAPFSMQADGKLALGHNAELSGDCRLEWYSPAEPVPHRLNVCPRGDVRMANNRIVAVRAGATTDALYVVALNGDFTSPAFFEAGALTGFDWDGTKLAYGVQGCTRTDDKLWVDDLGGNEPPTAEGGPCTAEVLTRNARADSKGLIRVKVACADGCSGLLTLYSGRSVASRRSASFSIRSGGAARSVPIRLGTLREVRRRGSKSYTARVEIDRRGANTQAFRGTVRVLAPKR